jgi:hypothetical protein
MVLIESGFDTTAPDLPDFLTNLFECFLTAATRELRLIERHFTSGQRILPSK